MFGVLVALALGYVLAPVPATAPPAGVSSSQTATSSDTFTLAPSEPVHLSIPAANITAAFADTLYLADNGEIEVPDGYESVGYYGYGPTPGELGPAVVLGHVDSYQGPAVFWSLGQLEAGDRVLIDRADGSTAVFAVTRLERHQQSGFPTQQVYGDIDHAGLRLITCSGTYDRGIQRYTHNLIVFAELIGTSTAAVTSGE